MTDAKTAHTSDGAATEKSAEVCSVCAYVITPAHTNVDQEPTDTNVDQEPADTNVDQDPADTKDDTHTTVEPLSKNYDGSIDLPIVVN